MTKDEMLQRLDHLGFDLEDYSDHPNYRHRKGSVFGIIDRRTARAIATYSTVAQIKKWIERTFPKWTSSNGIN
jgi:hypothetical protein